jgi:hypothetical protein
MEMKARSSQASESTKIGNLTLSLNINHKHREIQRLCGVPADTPANIIPTGGICTRSPSKAPFTEAALSRWAPRYNLSVSTPRIHCAGRSDSPVSGKDARTRRCASSDESDFASSHAMPRQRHTRSALRREGSSGIAGVYFQDLGGLEWKFGSELLHAYLPDR